MGLDFSGAEQVDVSGWPVPSVTGKISVSFWIKPMNLAATLQRVWGSGSHMECRTAIDGKIFNDMFEGASPGLESVTALVNGTLYHIVCTGDGAADAAETYINGVLDVSTAGGATGTSVGTTMAIGHRTGAPVGERFQGVLCDWRSYNRILTPAEVQTIYTLRGIDGIVHGLTARFLFDEGAPGTVATAVKDIGPSKLGSSIVASPVYETTPLKSRRRVA